MPKALIDGVAIYYESHGEGFPLVWSHEFAGDYRSWEDQVRFFSRRYRVITYNARGYPPSDVPDDPDAYCQERSMEDLKGLLDHLDIESAHIGGLSMGGSVALHFGIRYPEDGPVTGCRRRRNRLSRPGGIPPDREQAGRPDGEPGECRQCPTTPRAPCAFNSWQRTRWAGNGSTANSCHTPAQDRLAHSGAFRPGERPSSTMEPELRALDVPTLIVLGDEDDPCIEPGVFMKRCIRRSGMAVFPKSGHAINLEEPDLFNRTVGEFLSAVETNSWPERLEGAEAGRLA